MRTADLEQYLHSHMPLSRAMQVSVREIRGEQVTLYAPLEPNINHRQTAFGGSISTLAILSAWSLIHIRLAREGLIRRLVIQRNEMSYDAPIMGAFEATASLASEAEWPYFLRMLSRKGKGRILVRSELSCQGCIAGRFMGEFVALND